MKGIQPFIKGGSSSRLQATHKRNHIISPLWLWHQTVYLASHSVSDLNFALLAWMTPPVDWGSGVPVHWDCETVIKSNLRQKNTPSYKTSTHHLSSLPQTLQSLLLSIKATSPVCLLWASGSVFCGLTSPHVRSNRTLMSSFQCVRTFFVDRWTMSPSPHM